MKVEQARAQWQRAQMDYGYTTIVSPFAGYVDRIPYKVGSLVNPESLLTTVSDISEVFAYYKVNESEYLRFKRAQLKGENLQQEDNVNWFWPTEWCTVIKDGRKPWRETLKEVPAPLLSRVRFPNPDGLLKHGVTGKVRMLTRMEDVCLVPQKSTFEIQDFTYVYLVDSLGVAKVRSFDPIERYQNYYITQDLQRIQPLYMKESRW